jgi:hypothetical protein
MRDLYLEKEWGLDPCAKGCYYICLANTLTAHSSLNYVTFLIEQSSGNEGAVGEIASTPKVFLHNRVRAPSDVYLSLDRGHQITQT